jgi:hypothetical protein
MVNAPDSIPPGPQPEAHEKAAWEQGFSPAAACGGGSNRLAPNDDQ